MKKAVCFSDASYQFAAALLFLVVLVLVHPNVEVGMNDDWSFIRTAHDLAVSGHLRYNGWSAPLIGFQAYWGALFIKVFGFSFLAVRASAWTLAFLSIPILWNLFRSAQLNPVQSLFALLAFLLSPLNLPNLLTFMTDMPAFFFFIAALWAAMKAWGAEQDKSAYLWTCVSAACGIVSGSIRQIYWLSGLCFLTVLAFTRMRSLRGRTMIIVLIALTLAFGIAASHWLAQQPYVPAEITLQDLRQQSWAQAAGASTKYMARYFVGLAVLLTPFSLLHTRAAIKRLPIWIHPLILFAAVALTRQLAQPLPWLGNTLTAEGVLLHHTVSVGERPFALPATLILLISSFGLATALYALIHLTRTVRLLNLQTECPRLTALAMPFLLSYLAVIAVRSVSYGLYDRYLIPVVFIFSTMALAALKNQSIASLSWGTACIFALYAIATTHDYFSEAHAKLQATEQILQSGHTRQTILSGFEFDSWSQVERTGYVNNDLLTWPKNAYRETDDCTGPDATQMWWRTLTPDVKATYIVSLTRLSSLPIANFPPVQYQRWLPPSSNQIYVELSDPPLTCKASDSP